MSAPYNLSDETMRRLDEIVRRELIGGETPQVSLYSPETQRDETALSDSAFMARHFTTRLARPSSTLWVKPMEYYWFEKYRQILGSFSMLGLCNTTEPDGEIRLFIVGAYTPGITWHPMATGALLERNRTHYFDNIERERLRKAGTVTMRDIAFHVELLVRRRMAETPPTAQQSRLLGNPLSHMYDLTKLDSWSFICQMMGYNFPEILAEASLAVS